MVKRIYSYGLIVLVIVLSCKQKGAIERSANSIMNKSIEVSGGEKIKNSVITFRFRDKNYKATRENGMFVLERNFKDSTGIIRDELSNSGFKRYINEELQNLPDTLADNYANSVNSVHYFSILPFGLNDPAVNKNYLGETAIGDKEYHKIKITFDEKGGGSDFEDEFIYWVGKEDYKVDYLAYSFRENGGGMRFRRAYNERYLKGIRFVDYENYKPQDTLAKLIEIDQLFELNKLQLISKIELRNLQVK